jgi:hypothetical protein
LLRWPWCHYLLLRCLLCLGFACRFCPLLWCFGMDIFRDLLGLLRFVFRSDWICFYSACGHFKWNIIDLWVFLRGIVLVYGCTRPCRGGSPVCGRDWPYGRWASYNA